MALVDLVLVGVSVAGILATAVVRFWRPAADRVLLCQLGDNPRFDPTRSSEEGADGLRLKWFSDGHVQRRLMQRRWVRGTRAKDDQVNMYFCVPRSYQAIVAPARHVVGGVEYFDRSGRDAACEGFVLQCHIEDQIEATTPMECYAGTDTWRTGYFDLTGIALDSRLPLGGGGADLRIHLSDHTPPAARNDLEVRRVFILALD